MSYRSDLRDYFARLRVRYVLSRTLGKGGKQPEELAVRPSTAAAIAFKFSGGSHDRYMFWMQTRREVDALCASISAPRKGNLR